MPFDSLSEVQHKLLPTESDIKQYQELGYYNTPIIISDEEIERALAGVTRHHAGQRDVALPIERARMSDWQPGDSDQLRINDYPALTNHDIRQLLANPVLCATAALLSGASQLRLWQSGIIAKEPHTTQSAVGIGWHTDRAYWQTCTSQDMLTAWVPLHDCDEAMGTVMMLDGSHRWPVSPLVDDIRLSRTFRGKPAEQQEGRLQALERPITRTPMCLKRGQVSFHHCMVVHSSGPNETSRPRIAVTLDFQPADNHYRRVVNAEGRVQDHANDWLCRRTPGGEPDYADPDYFPTVWPL